MKKNAPRGRIQGPSVFHLTALSFVTSFMAPRVIVRYRGKVARLFRSDINKNEIGRQKYEEIAHEYLKKFLSTMFCISL